ncbi:MAG: RadC family protein [Fusobacteriota bacterium]
MGRKNNGHRQRLRNRYKKKGIDSLLDYEILELLLTYAIPRKDCKIMAKKMLEKHGNLSTTLKASKKSLLNIKGIGESTYIFLKFIKDIQKIYLKETKIDNEYFINSTVDLVNYLKIDMDTLNKEVFRILLLNNQNKFLKDKELFEGTLDKSHIYPREIIEIIFNYDAKKVIFVHNHPSGKVNPSKADKEITRKMNNVLGALDIKLLDHLIIGKDGYYSFLENRLI